MSKNTIKVVELFAGVGGFRIGLKAHRMPTKLFGTTNGSHQPNIRMLRSFIEHVLGPKVIVIKTSILFLQTIFLIVIY